MGRFFAGTAAAPLWQPLGKSRGNATIICYHRVAPMEKVNYPSNLTTPPQVFERHLQFLAARFTLISMDELISDLGNKSSRKDRAVITFDDGYAGFRTFALPLLEKYRLPATIYLCNDFLDGKGLQWWHLIDEALQSHRTIRFSWQKQSHSFSPSQDRKLAYSRIRSLFLNSNAADLHTLADKLIRASGISPSAKRRYPMMTWDALNSLGKSSQITVGAHTKSHCALSRQTPAEVLGEMCQNKSALEQVTNRKVDHFAYPFGTPEQSGEREYRLAEQAGFASGITLTKGHVHYESTDRFALPRFHIPGGNFSGIELCAMLSGLETKWHGLYSRLNCRKR